MIWHKRKVLDLHWINVNMLTRDTSISRTLVTNIGTRYICCHCCISIRTGCCRTTAIVFLGRFHLTFQLHKLGQNFRLSNILNVRSVDIYKKKITYYAPLHKLTWSGTLGWLISKTSAFSAFLLARESHVGFVRVCAYSWSPGWWCPRWLTHLPGAPQNLRWAPSHRMLRSSPTRLHLRSLQVTPHTQILMTKPKKGASSLGSHWS